MSDVAAGGDWTSTSLSPPDFASADAVANALPMATTFNTLVIQPRLVSCAPLGRPVVPEV